MYIFIILIWILSGLYTMMRYGDLWTMIIVWPFYLMGGPIGLIYYIIKEFKNENI